jgi:hypothetical protein
VVIVAVFDALVCVPLAPSAHVAVSGGTLRGCRGDVPQVTPRARPRRCLCRPACRDYGQSDYVFDDGQGHDYYANICGNSQHNCLPPSWLATYEEGVAVQFFGDTPPCDRTNKSTLTCTDKYTNRATCCTADCQVLGVGSPTWALLDPTSFTSGVTATFIGAPPDKDDPFWCPWNPNTGSQYPRTVKMWFTCDTEVPIAAELVAIQNNTENCECVCVVWRCCCCCCCCCCVVRGLLRWDALCARCAFPVLSSANLVVVLCCSYTLIWASALACPQTSPFLTPSPSTTNTRTASPSPTTTQTPSNSFTASTTATMSPPPGHRHLTIKDELSGGWIFVIILTCGSFVYVVGGMIFIKQTQHTWEFPNSGFWMSLGGYVSDGITIVSTCGKAQKISGGYGGVGGGGGTPYDSGATYGGSSKGSAVVGVGSYHSTTPYGDTDI